MKSQRWSLSRNLLAALALPLALGGRIAVAGADPATPDSRPPRVERPKEGARPPGGPRAMAGDRLEDMTPESMLLRGLLNNPDLAAKLDISEQQMQTLKTAGEKMAGELRELENKLRESAVRQARLVVDPQADEAALMKAVDESFDIRREIAKARVKQLLLVRHTLTPDQLAKARRGMVERWRAKRRAMDGEGGDGPQRPKTPHGEGEPGAPPAPPPPGADPGAED